MAAYTESLMTHVTCRLTAENRDQLQNPTLSNRVWATCTFLLQRGLRGKGSGGNGREVEGKRGGGIEGTEAKVPPNILA